ncbi:hypothetical protein A6M27_13015 [Acidithiobacillus thiooxidans]|uniref:Uncharacterized protein n=1 Tax=Acidithiobacillus thiooxidans TaxID=930 RepID=A0A1C2HX27_ACITH|nr:hypothetical protein A6P07_18610 [Acidithiobacillus thiooxidans]OCX75831.1 hypothetical protein A6O24_09635 [Acidithiobacillus thiooxidans]OCX79530.1 hypothetical protein A6O26_16405 [Acidithiobacillus thiooxidans]OCX86299.1 hypothetical protein A6M27_13015 [Acidithiobacillus thiooxidans]OFC51198.1 hypothetical protein BAE47_00150 [Acidithiobacillus thiooxidans]
MIVQQSQKVHHRGHRGRLAPLVTGEGVPSATSEPGRLHLGEVQFSADTPDIFPLSGARAMDEVVMRVRDLILILMSGAI